MSPVVVREHARLTAGVIAAAPSLDQASIPESAFEWLCRESERLRASGAPLVQLDDRRWLRLDNYVGVIETPCGTSIEILPKSSGGVDDAAAARALLRRMLSRSLGVTPRETGPASIQTFGGPLTEWVMREFLVALDRLMRRGLRFDYRPMREQLRYLRGRLDVSRQLLQPIGRQHLFRIEHDVFDADRAENRLLRSALDKICLATRDAENWRLSRELATRLAEVPPSTSTTADFRCWRNERLMAHYRDVRPWCSLILDEQTPTALVGGWQGRSLLFPMERLFERYVEVCLRRTLARDAVLKSNASSRHLCRHREQDWFLLKPDFLVEHRGRTWVLDTKWKLLDAALDSRADKYRLSQSDFYQLFAYGHRYLGGTGTMLLVYPRTPVFREPLPAFSYGDGLTLRVVPFDLDSGRLATGFLPENAVLEGASAESDAFRGVPALA